MRAPYTGSPASRVMTPSDSRHRRDDIPNTFAPEGASRCRALTSGLRGRAAGRKERLSENWRRLNPRSRQKSRNVTAKATFSVSLVGRFPLAETPVLRPIGHENHPPPCSRPARRRRHRRRRPVILDVPHENLCRPGLRSFRRHAFLRSRRRAAEIARGSAALAVRPRPAAAGLARMGAEPLCRYAAAARRPATRCGCRSSATPAG